MKICILDYKMGNLHSIVNSIKFLGYDPLITNNSKDLINADKIILPGVGSFNQAIENIKDLDLFNCLVDLCKNEKKIFLGICLGMQVLFSLGHENFLTKGLDLVKGEVKIMELDLNEYKIPHIGWNKVFIKKENILFNNLPYDEGIFFYFLHSFHVVPFDKKIITSTFKYSNQYVASIEYNNIFATQFHPEKSQKQGIEIINNFLKY